MKKSIWTKMSLLASLLLLATIALSSCNKDQDVLPTPDTLKGTWEITVMDYDIENHGSVNFNFTTHQYNINGKTPDGKTYNLSGSLDKLPSLEDITLESLFGFASYGEALRTFEFNGDSTGRNHSVGPFKYELSDGKLIIYYEIDSKSVYEVISFRANQMKLKEISQDHMIDDSKLTLIYTFTRK